MNDPPAGRTRRRSPRPALRATRPAACRSAFVLALAAATIAVPELAAQQPDSLPSPDTVARSDTLRAPDFVLGPVVVRVLGAPALRASLPYPVSVRSGSELRAGRSGISLEEALEELPGLRIQNRYNFAVGERVAVRGFGSRAQFGVRGVRVVVDGIPATLPDGQSTLDHVDPGSLGRVELLRGPASAHHGNAGGGVLVLHTRRPAEGAARAEVLVTGGSHGASRAHALVSGSPGSLGYVIGASRIGWDGFREDPRPEGGGLYGGARRLHLNGRLGGPLAGGAAAVTVSFVELDAENPGSLTAGQLAAGETPAAAFNVSQGTGKSLSQTQGGVTWDGPLPGGAGVDLALALHGIRRDLRNPIPPTIVEVGREAGGARAELRGGGEGGPEWIVGGEVGVQRDERTNHENAGGEAGARTLDQEESVRTLGAFGRLHWPLGPRVRVMAGVRWDHFRFAVRDHFLDGGDPDDSGRRTMQAWSPAIGVAVAAAAGVTLRASVASAYETPTTTELANRPDGAGGFNPGLEPRRSVTVEVGGSGRHPAAGGARITWEASIWRTRLRDELVPFEVPGAAGRSFYRNAGSSRYRGAEVSVRGRLPSGASLSLGWDWVDAVFREYVVDGEDFTGRRVPGVAPHRLEATVGWESDRGMAALRAEWTDRIPADDAGTARAPSRLLLDLRGEGPEWAPGALRLRPVGGVTNLLDEVYAAAVSVNAFGGRYFEPGPGRSAYLGVRATF